jgi:protein-S-isoprenylcysteine O-methyltransferase Ste14
MKYPVSFISFVLVAIQLGCLTYLGFTGPWLAVRIELQIWELSGVFLALAGLAGLHWKSFSVFPEPKPKGQLVQTGVYAFIRHPMYAGVLVVCATLIWQYFSWDRVAAGLVLMAVFLIKIWSEEKFLLAKYPEYHAYCEKTNRLIPFIW